MKSIDHLVHGFRNSPLFRLVPLSPFPGLYPQVQFKLPVNAVHALVVPAVALGTQPVKALPESPTAMAADHAIEGLDDRSVLDRRLFCPGLVQSRPRYPRDPAGLASGEVVFILQHLHDAQPGGRLYDFRDSTSLMAGSIRSTVRGV